MSTPAALLTIPEFILHDTLESLLSFVRTDNAASVISGDNTKSYLYKLLNNAGFQRYNFFDQAIAVFTLPIDDPRYLEVQLMFNVGREGAPTIHITMPAEQTAGQGNGFGVDEGYADYLTTEEDDTDPDNPILGTQTPVYTRRYQAVYNIVITSDNSNEVILIFHVVKALLTAVTSHLHESSIQNITLGGADINPYNDVVRPLYMRAVQVTLQYDTSVPSIYPLAIPSGIVPNGTPVELT